jgi:hypothetical protein
MMTRVSKEDQTGGPGGPIRASHLEDGDASRGGAISMLQRSCRVTNDFNRLAKTDLDFPEDPELKPGPATTI